MIDLVLQDAGPEAARGDGHGLAVRVARLDLHPRGARDRREHARDRQASFLSRDFATLLDDRGVEERLDVAPVLVSEHDEPERDAHLGRGEADADLVVHGVGHVHDHRPDLGRDLGHWPRAAA